MGVETNTEKAIAVLEHASLQGLSDEKPTPGTGTEIGNAGGARESGSSVSAPQEKVSDPSKESTEDKPEITSPRFALLAKKEKALQKEREEIKSQREELHKLKEEYNRSNDNNSLDEAKRIARDNPKKALEMLGLTYNQVTEFFLNDEKPTPELLAKSVEDRLRTEFNQTLEERDKKKREEEEKELKSREEKALEDFRNGVVKFVSEKVDDYELINLYDAQEIVVSTIEQHFEKTQRILSTKEAADLVENYLLEQARKAKKLAQPQGGEKSKAASTPRVESAQPKTLTNTMTSSAPSILPPKTEEDRIRRALAKLA